MVLAEVFTRSAYESKFVREMRRQYPARDVSSACARKRVEAAVAYAAKTLGLDVPNSMQLLADEVIE